jgi:hypothetical protein
MGTRAARIRATDESVLLQLLQQRCHSLDLNPVLCGKTIEIDLWIPLDPNEQPRSTGAEREAGARNDLRNVLALNVAICEDSKLASQLGVGFCRDRTREGAGGFVTGSERSLRVQGV